jgi:hypothetical protein
VQKEGKLPKVEAVRVFSTLTIPRRTASTAATASFRQNAKRRTTVVKLDPGRRLRDLGELRFDVAEPVFDRPVAMEVAYVEPAKGKRIAYAWWSEARLARKKPLGLVVIGQFIPAARYVRISIANGDDQPLTIKGVELVRIRRGLAFSAEPGGRYELWYGRKQAPSPSYDLSKLPLMRPDTLTAASLGRARALALAPPPPPPWSERHPGIFWGVLVGVAILLLAVIIRAMRMAGATAQDGTV